MVRQQRLHDGLTVVFLSLPTILHPTPILMVLVNSLKGRFFISDTRFALRNAQRHIIEGVVAGAVKG